MFQVKLWRLCLAILKRGNLCFDESARREENVFFGSDAFTQHPCKWPLL